MKIHKNEQIRVGDVVVFRQFEDMEKEYGYIGTGTLSNGFVDRMKPLCGETCVVSWVSQARRDGNPWGITQFKSDEGVERGWCVTNAMVHKVPESEILADDVRNAVDIDELLS